MMFQSRQIDREKRRITKNIKKVSRAVDANTKLLEQLQGLEELLIVMRKGGHV